MYRLRILFIYIKKKKGLKKKKKFIYINNVPAAYIIYIYKKKKDYNFYINYKFRVKVVRLGNELINFTFSIDFILLF